MKKIECIIWDWNGTILDDSRISCECVNYILRKRNMPQIDLETYKSYVDSPITKFYEHLFDLNDVSFETIAREYNKRYKELEEGLTLVRGVRETLDYFHRLGTRQIIISASHYSYIEKLSEKLEIDRYFDAVIAADDYTVGSKIDRAKEYFASSGISPGGCIVIGDTRHDKEMADALGVRCLLTTLGHESYSNLISSSACVSDTISPEIIQLQFEK